MKMYTQNLKFFFIYVFQIEMYSTHDSNLLSLHIGWTSDELDIGQTLKFDIHFYKCIRNWKLEISSMWTSRGFYIFFVKIANYINISVISIIMRIFHYIRNGGAFCRLCHYDHISNIVSRNLHFLINIKLLNYKEI